MLTVIRWKSLRMMSIVSVIVCSCCSIGSVLSVRVRMVLWVKDDPWESDNPASRKMRGVIAKSGEG